MSSQRAANFVPEVTVSGDQWGLTGPARKMIPVATEGPLGASYTVYEKNWTCADCGHENYASKARCHRCRAHRPEPGEAGGASEADRVIAGPAPEAAEWREAVDPDTKHVYYVNVMTGHRQWERPEAMGPAPHETGWFGRGAMGSSAAEAYEARNATYLARPARKQIEHVPTKGAGYLEGAYEYNIWYNKYLGDHWTSQKDREPAETRVDLARDAGHTKADRHDNNLKFFCLYFARGCCAHGKDCQFAHRIPVNADIKRLALDETKDIFGRERHREHRDDMGGVGAIMKPCRTLYAGGLTKTDYKDPRALEECLWRHFGDFGEIENINLIARLSIAFVRYRYRSAAEFAKEAMSNQKLDAEENINVRWAYDDPNPVAEAAAARADADAMVKLLQAKGVDFGKGDVALQAYPADYAMPAAKKARLENGEEVEVAREQLYPNTDTQFGGAAGAAGAAGGEEVQSYTKLQVTSYKLQSYKLHVTSTLSIGPDGPSCEKSSRRKLVTCNS